MKWISAIVLLITTALVISCTSSYESRGNKAYKASQNAQGDTKRRLQKEAYVYYHKAIKAHPNKVSKQLNDRFIEMTVTRANMVLREGSYLMDAIALYIRDVDKYMTPEISPNVRKMYVDFIVTLADSNIANSKIYEGLRLLDKAISISQEPKLIEDKKNGIVDSLSSINFEIANSEYKQGVSAKDTQSLLRAEYYAQLALFYKKDYPEAEKLLSKIRRKNLSTYSAYDMVITDKPDSNVYDQINKYDILLAVSSASRSVINLEMYNYSYNPLRLKAKHFFVENTKGKRYVASSASKMGKEILDQEHECKIKLIFPNVSGKIKKIIYDNGDQYTEKYFF